MIQSEGCKIVFLFISCSFCLKGDSLTETVLHAAFVSPEVLSKH